MRTFLPDVFAPISTVITHFAAASASLNTEPILKRVVPMNHTNTYTWGNRAQVEKYRSYPLMLSGRKNSTCLMYHGADLCHGQRMVTSLQSVFRQTQVQELKLQTKEPFMEERPIPSHQITPVRIQRLQLFENFNLWKIWTVRFSPFTATLKTC